MKSCRKKCAYVGCVLMSCMAICSLAGCQGAGTPSSSGTVVDATPLTAAKIVAPKPLTFTPLYFEEKKIADPVKYFQDKGYTDIVTNEDGSYTAMPSDDERAAVAEDAFVLAKSIIESIPEDDNYPNCVAVDYDEQLATVTVTFSTDALLPAESLIPYIPGEAAVMYQQAAGLPVGCDVILVGAGGSELLSTHFPVPAAPAGDAPAQS